MRGREQPGGHVDIGELLYDKLETARVAAGRYPGVPWVGLSVDDQEALTEGARLFLEFFGTNPAAPFGAQIATPIPATPPRNWKAELTKFGRHSPGCSPYGLCNCGYAEIEKELGT
jgi:hypothetical protein